jgi:hypothetical protein
MKQRFARMEPKDDYQKVVNEYAQDGWRLIQVFAPPIFGYGLADHYDLIFEREVK